MTTIGNNHSKRAVGDVLTPVVADRVSGGHARECASALLSTIPLIMRRVAATTRNHLTESHEQITFRQVQLIEMLAKQDMSLTDLSMMHSVTPSAMSRSVDVLVHRGWIERRDDTHDRRQVSLKLTAEGERVRQRLHEDYERVFEHAFRGLGAENQEIILSGLRAIQHALHV